MYTRANEVDGGEGGGEPTGGAEQEKKNMRREWERDAISGMERGRRGGGEGERKEGGGRLAAAEERGAKTSGGGRGEKEGGRHPLILRTHAAGKRTRAYLPQRDPYIFMIPGVHARAKSRANAHTDTPPRYRFCLTSCARILCVCTP